MHFLHECLNRRYLRITLLLLLDVVIIVLSTFSSFWLRIDVLERMSSTGVFDNHYIFQVFLWVLGIRLVCNWLFNLYNWSFSRARFNEGMQQAASIVLGTVTFVVLGHVFQVLKYPPPRSIYVLEMALTFLGMFILRFFPGYLLMVSAQRLQQRAAENNKAMRTVIYGSSDVAEMLARELLQTRGHDCTVVGFIDDNLAHLNSSIGGVSVLGSIQNLASIIDGNNIEQLLLVGDELSGQSMRYVVDICGPRRVRLKNIPAYRDIFHSFEYTRSLKNIDPERLLDRQPVNFDSVDMNGFLKGKTVLVTGAGGTIGGELCRQVAGYEIQRLLFFDINENALFFLDMELREAFPERDIVLLLGSIRDRCRLEEMMVEYQPDIIFHAAAHKHVPILENAPKEAIKNNILATFEVADCACKYNVKHFIFISSDKAVTGANILGLSKRQAELVIRNLNTRNKTKFQIVRFGNVLGSNGSLVEIINKQIACGGPVTVTHPDMERYFMTIQEAVGLVLVAAAIGEGEINVLDMGDSIKVETLIRQMIYLAGYIPDQDIEIHYTAPRRGEQLREYLYNSDDVLKSSSFPKIKIVYDETQLDVNAMLTDAYRVCAMATDAAAREFLFSKGDF